MRIIQLTTTLVALLALHASVLRAEGVSCTTEAGCGTSCNSGCQDCVTCRPKGCKGCCFAGGRGYEGLDRHYNCQCNGSYKFPVPPLYTYHWPGIYSHQLMTEYQSPWRFPPIKPYQDEKLEPRQNDMPAAVNQNAGIRAHISDEVQQVDFSAPSNVRPGQADSMSNKLKKISRYAP